MHRNIAIGVDIGGSHISCAAIDLFSGEILKDTLTERAVDNKAQASLIIDVWTDALSFVLAKVPLDKVKGIGFGMPGPFDYVKGICFMRGVAKYENLYGLNVADSISNSLNVPKDFLIRFINDATAFAVGEAWLGRASKACHSLSIALGTGLGSALTMLCIPYGSKEAIDFTEYVSFRLAVTGWITGVELAKEKGPAPIMTEGFSLTNELFRKQPLLKNEYSEGMTVIGKVLFAEYSEYMLRLYDAMGEAGPILKQDLLTHGCRFTHHSSIAPTGTISLALANNASNGIEPSFSHKYFRNLTIEGKKTRQQVPVYSYELLLYGHLVDSGVLNEEYGGFIPNYFVSSDAVTPTQHVDMQAAAQKWIDSSISKTINCPTDMKFDVFKNIYGYAAEKGLKGCTTFRFNPTAMTGVLTRKEDLDSTLYRFYLTDGTEIELKGSDKVEYEGEIHNVAMLYDSIKEGRYDRGY